uniref:ADP-ribosylation factor-like protein 13B n=1 Tax=Ditylenchus dipsaci TaxID=166011 RepID=A0A915DCN0_9BILA
MGNCVDCVGGFKRRTRISPWKKSRTIVLCFLGEDLGTVHPTIGFSRAEFMLKKYKIVAYDLGGGERIREIWPTYYAEVYGIVYVVDSAAISRLAENKRIVDSLVERPELMGKPILFLLNKKDLPEAIDEMQFSDRFELHNMAKSNKTDIRVEGICAVKGSGKEMDAVISEGVEWLIERVVENYTNIEKGVQAALKTLQERQAQDRLERQHRLAMLAASRAEESHSDDRKNGDDGAEILAATSKNYQENANAPLQPIANGTAVDHHQEDLAISVSESIKRKSLPSIKSNKILPVPQKIWNQTTKEAVWTTVFLKSLLKQTLLQILQTK